MSMPHFPRTEPCELPPVIESDEFPYIGADAPGIGIAAFYGIALQRSLDDAADLLEPQLPAEIRPYVEVFERYLLHRAEQYMKRWTGSRHIEPDAPGDS